MSNADDISHRIQLWLDVVFFFSLSLLPAVVQPTKILRLLKIMDYIFFNVWLYYCVCFRWLWRDRKLGSLNSQLFPLPSWLFSYFVTNLECSTVFCLHFIDKLKKIAFGMIEEPFYMYFSEKHVSIECLLFHRIARISKKCWKVTKN